MDFVAGLFDEEAENEFDDDACNEDNDSDSCIVGSLGVDELFDGFDKSGEAGVKDDGGDRKRGNIFDATVAERMIAIGGSAGEFGADDGNDTRESIT